MLRSFDALMALASKQTEASQHALAKENQLRQAREKAKRLEEERKEKERLRLEKERLAKQKLEDQRREQQLLEERQRRQAERAAAAETSRKQDEPNRPSSSKLAKPAPNASLRSRPVGRTASSTPVPSSKDAEEQRRLEREEKQARARARLFGEPVSAHKKPTTSRPATNSARNISFGKGKGVLRPSSPACAPKTASNSSTPFTARQRIEQQFSASERKPLNQGKRDRRTIEEIEQDMRRRKGATGGTSPAAGRATRDTIFESRSVPKKTIVPLKPIASGSTLSGPPSARAVSGVGIKRKAMSPTSTTQPLKRTQPGKPLSRTNGATSSGSASRLKNVASQSEGEDEEDEYEEDSAVEVETVSPAIRDEIWKIMGKDRKQYAAKTILSDDESEDMEADVDDVLEEEGRAARLARLEDQREQEALRRHEFEKKKRLSQSRSK